VRPADVLSAEGSTPRSTAFVELAERHLDASYRLARAILHDPAEAEDATHDAIATAWRQFSTLRNVAQFEAWFHRILVNTCRNRLTRAARWRTQAHPPDRAAGGDEYRQADDRDLIGAALRQLTPDHRIVVALRFYRDLSVDEIAKQLGIRPGTVHSRLHYALKRLAWLIDAADAKRTDR
jgi:RNA polymerase sigma-70 factor, ECF subfamily